MIQNIKKFLMALFIVVATMLLSACQNGDTTEIQSTSYDVGGDLYVQNGDGTITIINTETGEETQTEVPFDPDNYPGPEADKATCNALGFFWCPIQKKCLNKPLESGTCPEKTK